MGAEREEGGHGKKRDLIGNVGTPGTGEFWLSAMGAGRAGMKHIQGFPC